jgi:hypothetical protein
MPFCFAVRPHITPGRVPSTRARGTRQIILPPYVKSSSKVQQLTNPWRPILWHATTQDPTFVMVSLSILRLV